MPFNSNALTGANFIGLAESSENQETFRAYSVMSGAELPGEFHIASEGECARACELAGASALAFASLHPEKRATFLEAVADEIMALGDDLIQRAHLESSLPIARLEGERARTTGQLRMFAKVLREGRWLDARIELAIPDRTPLPRVDLRRTKRGIGPIAVFGASNFPLAFSVAGGDSASAWAAGCPVVVKAHHAHPGTSELVALAVQRAVEAMAMPEGVFSMLHGHVAVGTALVKHPAIQGVGFTGSRQGGDALVRAAQSRPQPIPVFAEMGSVNPVFILPGAFAKHPDHALQYSGSLTLGAGQFCTNPGIVVAVDGQDAQAWMAQLSESIAVAQPQPMLTAGIAESYAKGRESRTNLMIASGPDPLTGQASPMVAATSASAFLANPALHEELFGPSAVVVLCQDLEEMNEVAHAIEGQLTASIWMGDDDAVAATWFLDNLASRAGRIIVNGFPTGVEVGDAIQHGGPYPATSDPRFTSVGTAAIERWAMAVCYQNVPNHLLPSELKNENPLGIPRLVNGTLTSDPILQ